MLKMRSSSASLRTLVWALTACLAIGLGALGDSSRASVTTYTYDNAGRLMTVYTTAGYKTSYSLDPAGNRTTVTTVGTPVIITFTAATASTSSINLTFSATDNGGPGGLTYSVMNTTLNRSVPSCTASPCTDTGLSTGTNYAYTITATDSNNNTGTASTNAWTLPGVPGTPTFSSIGATSATASWTAPSGTVTSYAYSLNGGSTWTNVGNVLSASITGLTSGTSYSVEVRATNAGGTGAAGGSGSFYTVPGAPGTPTFSTLATTSVKATWTAPSGTVTSYAYSINGGSTWTNVGNVLSASITGLTSATIYTVEVRASNAGGAGSASSASVETLPLGSTISVSPTSAYTEQDYSVSWTKPPGTLNHFTVGKAIGAGAFSYTNYPATTTSFTDSYQRQTQTSVSYDVQACVSSTQSACGVVSNNAVETIKGCQPGGCP